MSARKRHRLALAERRAQRDALALRELAIWELRGGAPAGTVAEVRAFYARLSRAAALRRTETPSPIPAWPALTGLTSTLSQPGQRAFVPQLVPRAAAGDSRSVAGSGCGGPTFSNSRK